MIQNDLEGGLSTLNLIRSTTSSCRKRCRRCIGPKKSSKKCCVSAARRLSPSPTLCYWRKSAGNSRRADAGIKNPVSTSGTTHPTSICSPSTILKISATVTGENHRSHHRYPRRVGALAAQLAGDLALYRIQRHLTAGHGTAPRPHRQPHHRPALVGHLRRRPALLQQLCISRTKPNDLSMTLAALMPPLSAPITPADMTSQPVRYRLATGPTRVRAGTAAQGWPVRRKRAPAGQTKCCIDNGVETSIRHGRQSLANAGQPGAISWSAIWRLKPS